jgi:hypothetical protein
MSLRKFKEIQTSGPKGQRICPVDVRAEARTYPTQPGSHADTKALMLWRFAIQNMSFSAACKAVRFVPESFSPALFSYL